MSRETIYVPSLTEYTTFFVYKNEFLKRRSELNKFKHKNIEEYQHQLQILISELKSQLNYKGDNEIEVFIHHQYALSISLTENFELAIGEFNEALNIAKQYIKIGEFDERKQKSILIDFGFALSRLERYKEALDKLNLAESFYPLTDRDGKVLIFKAYALTKLAYYDEACETYERALSLCKGNQWAEMNAHKNYAYTLALIDNSSSSYEHIEAALGIAKTSEKLFINLNSILAIKKHILESMGRFEEARDIGIQLLKSQIKSQIGFELLIDKSYKLAKERKSKELDEYIRSAREHDDFLEKDIESLTSISEVLQIISSRSIDKLKLSSVISDIESISTEFSGKDGESTERNNPLIMVPALLKAISQQNAEKQTQYSEMMKRFISQNLYEADVTEAKLEVDREESKSPRFNLVDLTRCIEDNNLEKFEKLYTENDVSTDSTYECGVTLLQVAVSHNNLKIIDFLLDHGHNPFKEDKYGNSAFTGCYLNENEKLAVDIFRKFIKINSIDISTIPSLQDSLKLEQKNHEFAIEFVKHICKKSEPENTLREELGFKSKYDSTRCFQTVMDYLEDEEGGGLGELYMYHEFSSDGE